MPSIPVKQCTVSIGQEARFRAEVGDTVTVRSEDGIGLVAAHLEEISGGRVVVRTVHDGEAKELAASDVVGVLGS